MEHDDYPTNPDSAGSKSRSATNGASSKSHVRSSRGFVALLISSALIVAFAGGMLFQRVFVSDGAIASESATPETFDRAWDLVVSEYVDQSAIDEEQMLEAAIDGMLDTLGDEGHTRYLTPEESRAQRESLSGQYVGVGIQVEMRDDRIVVVAPIDNSPAMEAGVQPGDILIRVDGRDVTGADVSEVIPTIRGEEGTTVTLTFSRPGEPEPLEFTLTRRPIEISSVSWAMLPDDVADIRLSQFSSGAADDMIAAIREAQEAGAKGYILDLRNNPGGYINEAISIGSLFVPEGSTIFVSEFRGGDQEPHVATEQPVNVSDLPIVVLINEGSASSSEIVSGAIKANSPNATVIGMQTFGTGTVLSSYDLGEDAGRILLGTELWLTPEGKLIKNRGIRPDVVVDLPEGQSPFIPVDNAENEVDDLNDHQLEWALDVITSGQAGSDYPVVASPPGRSS